MLDGVEIGSPLQTARRIRRALNRGLKLWDGARFVLADVPLNRAAVRKILPLGMRAARPCLGTVFVADYPKTAFTVGYKEAALLIRVETPLGQGVHCCWMVVDDDTALILGREMLGYPKKLAAIGFEESEQGVRASVSRRGKSVLVVDADRGRPQDPFPPVLSLKTFNAGGPGQCGPIHPIWLFRPKEAIQESFEADARIEWGDSPFDPPAGLIAGPPVNGRIVRMDILGSHYNLPVGLAGPQWFLNVYSLRYK